MAGDIATYRIVRVSTEDDNQGREVVDEDIVSWDYARNQRVKLNEQAIDRGEEVEYIVENEQTGERR